MFSALQDVQRSEKGGGGGGGHRQCLGAFQGIGRYND